MYRPAMFDLDDGDVLARLDVTDDLEVRDDLQTDFVPAGGHHPLFEIRTSDSGLAAVLPPRERDGRWRPQLPCLIMAATGQR